MPEICIALALFVAFVILVADKTGIRDYLVAISPRVLSRLIDCDLCLSFWLSLILAFILAFLFDNVYILFIPIFSTPLTRFLL